MKLGPELRDVFREFALARLGATSRGASRILARVGTWAGLLASLNGCGYQPVYGGHARHYEVAAGHYGTASFEAVPSVVDGVRAELGAAEALGGGGARVTVEVLRVEERSLGVRSVDGAGPLARGAEIVVVGRALVYEQPEGPARLDTGDMSRAAQYAAGSSPSADAAARSRAVRDAARSLGKALGRVVLGLPEPAEG